MTTNMLTAMDVFPTAAQRIDVDQAAMNAAAFGDRFQAQKIQNRLATMYANQKMESNEINNEYAAQVFNINAMGGVPSTPQGPPMPAGPRTPNGLINAMAPPQPEGMPAPQPLPVNQLMQGMAAPPGMQPPAQNALAAPGAPATPQQNAMAGPTAASPPQAQPKAASPQQDGSEVPTAQDFISRLPEETKRSHSPGALMEWAQGQVAAAVQVEEQADKRWATYITPHIALAKETGNDDLLQATFKAGVQFGTPKAKQMSQLYLDSKVHMVGKDEMAVTVKLNQDNREILKKQTSDPLVLNAIDNAKDGESIEVKHKGTQLTGFKPVKDVDAASKTKEQIVEESLTQELGHKPTPKQLKAGMLQYDKDVAKSGAQGRNEGKPAGAGGGEADSFSKWDKATKEWWFDAKKTTGEKPDFGWGKEAGRSRAQFAKEYALWAQGKGISGQEAGAGKEEFKGDSKALANDKKQYDLMRKSELQAAGAAKLLRASSGNYARGNVKFLNSWEALAKNSVNDTKLADLQMKLLSFSREYYKVTTNAYASSSELSIGAQHQADEMLSTSDSWASLETKIKAAEQEIRNTNKTFNQTINEREKSLRGGKSDKGGGDQRMSVAAKRIASDMRGKWADSARQQQVYSAMKGQGYSDEEIGKAFSLAKGAQ